MRNFKATIYTDDDEEIDHKFPSKKEICERCSGEGRHVNPAIDGEGITAEEWENEWDEESREMYLSGRYDIACEACNGLRVIDVADEDQFTETDQKYWQMYCEQQKSLSEMEDIYRMERAMGA